MRDSFIFYRSFYEAIKHLDSKIQGEIYTAIMEYSLYGKETELGSIAKAFFTLIKPQIDTNNQRYENGKKGGRKSTKQKPKANQSETKSEPNVNGNVNVNVNGNEYENGNVNEFSLSTGVRKVISKSLFETMQILLNDIAWIEPICMNNQKSIVQLQDYIKLFFAELQSRDDLVKTDREAKDHFSKWLSIQVNNERKQKDPKAKMNITNFDNKKTYETF